MAARRDSTLGLPKLGRPLTRRELQVLRLVAEGRSNKQVASELGISIKTVEKHRGGAMDKLGIHETSGLTRYAISMKITGNRRRMEWRP